MEAHFPVFEVAVNVEHGLGGGGCVGHVVVVVVVDYLGRSVDEKLEVSSDPSSVISTRCFWSWRCKQHTTLTWMDAA